MDIAKLFIIILITLNRIGIFIIRKTRLNKIINKLSERLIETNPSLKDSTQIVAEELGINPVDYVSSTILVTILWFLFTFVILRNIVMMRLPIIPLFIISLILVFLPITFMLVSLFGLTLGREIYEYRVRSRMLDVIGRLQTATSQEDIAVILADMPEIRDLLLKAIVTSRGGSVSLEEALKEAAQEWNIKILRTLSSVIDINDVNTVTDVVIKSSLSDFKRSMTELVDRSLEKLSGWNRSFAAILLMITLIIFASPIFIMSFPVPSIIEFGVMILTATLFSYTLFKANLIDMSNIYSYNVSLREVLTNLDPMGILFVIFFVSILVSVSIAGNLGTSLLVYATFLVLSLIPMKMMGSLTLLGSERILIEDIRVLIREYFRLRITERLNRAAALAKLLKTVRSRTLREELQKIKNEYDLNLSKRIWDRFAIRFIHPSLRHFMTLLEDADTLTTVDADERRKEILTLFEKTSLSIENMIKEKFEEAEAEFRMNFIMSVVMTIMIGWLGITVLPFFMRLFFGNFLPDPAGAMMIILLAIEYVFASFLFIGRKFGFNVLVVSLIMGGIAIISIVMLATFLLFFI